MQDGAQQNGDGFLPLGVAAARLGLSRLKLREAIAKGLLEARRDNEGRLRVDLDAAPRDLPGALAGRTAPPEALMAALFDEIEELSAEREAGAAAEARLSGLVAAQAEALERATALLDARDSEVGRLGAVVDRALAAAEAAGARAEALQATTERALGLLDGSTRALEAAQAEAAQLRADLSAREAEVAGQARMVDRLFSLSETALEAAARSRAAPSLVARVFGRGRG